MTSTRSEVARRVVRQVLDERRDMPGALLPILHGIQDALGHVPPDAVPEIAQALNRSRAEVHGVVSYYHHFRAEAPKGAVVRVCRAEACQACGADALWEHASARAAAAQVTLEPVYCLGLCATAPSISIDERPHARVSTAKFDRLLAQLREAA